MKFETRCVHEGVDKDPTFRSCTTPIYTASTFAWEELGKPPTFEGKEYDYTRMDNPTRRALEENLASLEGGVDARATSTGMSAILLAMQLFRPGDHIVTTHDIYGGAHRLFTKVLSEQGISFSFVDMRDPANIAAAVQPQTCCIYIETPSNPLLKIVDIAAVVEIAKKANVLTIIDNTFMSPYFQRPLDMGVDIVIHSTTKYLNGHSDVVGGCVISRTQEHADRFSFLTNAMGLACSPFDAWLVLRGIKTLAPRMESHQRNAMALAQMLAEHPEVEKVYYPGLESHEGHELAKQQMTGFGGIVSFDVKGGIPAANRVLTKTKLYATAVSLGGIESLIEHPATMSHASTTPEGRAEAGITDGTIRLSVGIEHPADLIADLKQALEPQSQS